jgi:hypothetical protein
LLQEDEARRAQLRAGAEALAVWLRARRDAWPEVPAEVAPSPMLSSLDGITAPAMTSAAVIERPVRYEPAALVANPVVDRVKPAKPQVRFKIPTEALRSLATQGMRWSLRAAALAAIVAVAVGVVRQARPYVVELLTVAKTGTVLLESLPAGSEVLVDGVSLGTAPLTAELPPGSHAVEFRQRNAKRKMEIDVKAGQRTVSRLDWSVAPTGSLTVRSDPDGARVLVDGRERGVTPLTLDDLALGPHTVVLQTAQGSVGRTVAVTADRTALVSESIYAGWLKLFAPFEVQIAEGTRALRVDDQNQVMLPPGSHELRLENRALGYSETRRVQIEPGKTTSLSLVPSPSTLTVTSSSPATVLIDGAQAGETPLIDHPVPLGTRDIVVRSATGQERRFTRRVTATPPVRIDVDFSKP